MNIFFQFILLIFLFLVLLVPAIAPTFFNFLGILFVRYIIPYEISAFTFSSILILSFLLSIFSLLIRIFLIFMDFNYKTISTMLANYEPLGFIIKFISEFVAILVGYTILKNHNFTNINFYRVGLLLFAFTSSCLNLIFSFCKSSVHSDKNNLN